MKRYLALLLLLSGMAYGYQSTTLTTGEALTFYKVGVSSTAVSVISNYGGNKNRTVCRNSSNLEVYIGSSTAVVAAHANSYEIGPSTTNAASIYDTTNKGTIYGISKGGGSNVAATTANVYCIEER